MARLLVHCLLVWIAAGCGTESGDSDVVPNRITVADLQFDVLQAGPPDGELVIMLHGFPQTSFAFREHVAFLAEHGYHVVAPDQRGYSEGASPWGVAPYHVDSLVADVFGLARALDREAFHLVGHDWGGAVAWLAAARRPGSVRSLFVISTPHPRAYAEAVAEANSAQAEMSSYMDLLTAPDAAARLAADSAAFLQELYSDAELPLAVQSQYLDALGSEEALRGPLAWYRALDLSELARTEPIKVPTTFLWGTDDPTISDEAAQSTARCVEGSYRFIPIRGAGHWIPERHPERLQAELLAHLTNIDSGGTSSVVKTGRVPVLDSEIFYREAGWGRPIVLVHGQPTSSFLWRDVIPDLARHGRVLALDLIGFGRSGRPAIEYSASDHVRYFAAFVDSMRLEDMVLVGHDWGSYVTSSFAVDNRQKVSGMVFLESIFEAGGSVAAPSGDGVLERRARTAFRIIREGAETEPGSQGEKAAGDAFINDFVRVGVMRTMSDLELMEYEAPFLDASDRAPLLQWPRQLREPEAFDEIRRYSTALETWGVPKLLMVVTPGLLNPCPVQRWAVERVPNLTLVDLGLGLHFFPEDYPEDVSHEIGRWMSEAIEDGFGAGPARPSDSCVE